MFQEKPNKFLFNRIHAENVSSNNSTSNAAELERIRKLIENQDREIQGLKNIFPSKEIQNSEGKWPKIKEEFIDWSLNRNFVATQKYSRQTFIGYNLYGFFYF